MDRSILTRPCSSGIQSQSGVDICFSQGYEIIHCIGGSFINSMASRFSLSNYQVSQGFGISIDDGQITKRRSSYTFYYDIPQDGLLYHRLSILYSKLCSLETGGSIFVSFKMKAKSNFGVKDLLNDLVELFPNVTSSLFMDDLLQTNLRKADDD
jgi:hypothetical protein